MLSYALRAIVAPSLTSDAVIIRQYSYSVDELLISVLVTAPVLSKRPATNAPVLSCWLVAVSSAILELDINLMLLDDVVTAAYDELLML